MHLFSLHYKETSAVKTNSEFVLTAPDICRRITRVLRLRSGQEFVLFDRHCNSTVRVQNIKKDSSVQLLVLNTQQNKIYKPTITFLLPLLKRDALEDAIGGLVASGVQSIQLVVTDTTQRKWQGNREQNRLEKIVISAAEQSRNYAFPVLRNPIPLSNALENYRTAETFFIYANPNAPPIQNMVQQVKHDKAKHLLLTVGPEADFSCAEKEMFLAQQAYSYSLTPTILRSPLAATLLSGICRSLLP